ncbi:MAG: MFS transporter [Halobacteria archaeon]|nr:MFS transporter [Halobacteria archaeon]
MSVVSAISEELGLKGHLTESDRHLLAYSTTAHSLNHAVMLSIPILVPIWVTEFGVTRYTLGLVVTAMAALFGVTSLPAGVISDRLGADTAIDLFLFGTGVALLGVLAVDSFASLGLVVALAGAGAGLYHSPALSLISRRADEPSKGFAYHGLGANIGIGLGPLGVTVGLTFTDWRTLLVVLGASLVVFGFVFRLWGPDDPVESDDEVKADADGKSSLLGQMSSFATVGFAAVVGVYIFAGMYYRGSLTFLPDFLNTVSSLPDLEVAGKEIESGRWVYSTILLIGSVGQIVGGNLGERFEVETVLKGVYVATSASFVVLGLGSGRWILAGGVAFGALLFTLPPLHSTVVTKYLPEDNRGVGFGLVFGINFGVGAVGAALAGWVLTQTGNNYGLMFFLLAVFPLGSLVSIIALKRVSGGEPVVSM